ncbi:MAG: DUF1641 domain-containing protein [Myxococcales bacterium]|nr:DUF1641 domain-containing protein [Myxococcales bacterium]
MPPESSTDARLLAAVERLDARLERVEAELAQLSGLLELAPAAIATAADTFDHYAARALEAGVDARIHDTAVLLERANDALTRALAITSDRGERVGPWGLLRALSDPDVQRSLALGVRFARLLGAELEQMDEGGTLRRLPDAGSSSR